MKKSAKKQQSQVQTIQRTITSRNVIQSNGGINKFWKGSRWLCRHCLRTFCYFLRSQPRKPQYGKLHLCPSILNADESQLTKCFALVACFTCCSLGDSS